MNKYTILCLLFITSCASYMGKSSFEIKKELSYAGTKNERQMADAFIPEGAGPFPGVILVHGGGWNSRHKGDMYSVAKSLASQGFTVFNINYRLSPEHRHPTPLDDLEMALKYFKLHASEFKLDPNRIGLWGYSSGGHTTSLYALTHADNPALKVNAVVTGGAPYDFTWYPYSPYIKGYMGAFRDQMLNEYFKASPTEQVTSQAPPFFIYHAEKDKLVEYAQSTAFEARLKSKNIYVKRHRIPFFGHGMAFIFSDSAIEKGIKFLKEKL